MNSRTEPYALAVLSIMLGLPVHSAAQTYPPGFAYQLTHSQLYDASPSSDGKRLVLVSTIGNKEQLFVMNADGSDVKRVANTEGRATAPHWARDGKVIYFTNCRKVDLGSDCQIFAAVPP